MFPRYFSGEITNWPRLLCYSLYIPVLSATGCQHRASKGRQGPNAIKRRIKNPNRSA